jgi:Arc/MetJ-type ribon-helix-helix transcriptional regulator
MAKKDAEPKRKITVSLPVALLEWLDGEIEGRKRSAFIAEAIEEKLDRIETVRVIEETAGAWKDEDYPHLATDEDIDRWLAELRGGAPTESVQKAAETHAEYKTS